jgi:hypothetical protein
MPIKPGLCKRSIQTGEYYTPHSTDLQHLHSSPLLASMNHLSVLPSSEPRPQSRSITEDSYAGLHQMWKNSTKDDEERISDEPQEWPTGAPVGNAARKKWMYKKENREDVILDKDWQITCEFGNGLIGSSSVSRVEPFNGY